MRVDEDEELVIKKQRVRTHALTTVWAISFVNLSRLCNFVSPSIAPPSSIRSLKNWQRTSTCWRERNLVGNAESTAVR